MSDDRIRTITLTDVGELPFQEYFVKYSCEPKILGVRFAGLERARPSEGFAKALRESDAIVLCPSNPVVSIGPVLAIPGVHECFESFAGPRLGVSPIVGGQALKGPAAKMMIELGEQSSNVGVASRYLGLLDTLVIDNTDRWEVPGIEALGIAAYVTSTVMGSGRDKTRLGKEILHLITDKLASMQASRG
jgi:LPPG:FO 2-phospho-L-lactate transferase